MPVKEKLQVIQSPGPAIRVPKGLVSEELHERLESLQDKIAYKEKRKVTKVELVVELLESHPKLRP